MILFQLGFLAGLLFCFVVNMAVDNWVVRGVRK